ncbi:MAG: transporter, family, fosmidomycin resistance protein [Variibacter sp.]|nr:transporter, family, fosmidomycin resistance protein [Variibacter sp.]
MTPTVDRAPLKNASDVKLIALVSIAHLISHYYILILPPLFTVIRADFGVSYTEIGLALTAFNILTVMLQTPAGFLVDRIGARPVLIGGLLVGALALTGAALLAPFWAFITMFGLLGVGNAVYHPADYSLLSQHVSGSRMSRAYSAHTFAGMIGGAIAPVTLLVISASYGWRGAYLASAAFGFATAALLILFGDALRENKPRARAEDLGQDVAEPVGWSLFLSAPILFNLVFFAFFALSNAGLQNYSVVALDAMRGTPLSVANAGLTAYLVMSAVGVLLGGGIATRVGQHALVATAGLFVNAIVVLCIVLFDIGDAAMITMLALAGLALGVMMPSRDMLVRAVTPPGAFGKVFGFVTTGFNIGGMISPIVFGWMMDSGRPAWIFVAAALFSLASIPIVIASAANPRPAR